MRMTVVPAQQLEQWVKPEVEGPAAMSPGQLVVVVGFDGSEAAYRALDAATRLISGRPGNIVVVYVAHVSAAAELTPEAVIGSLEGFDALEQQFSEAIRSRLDGIEQRWILQRRD